jgi:hypothetical protein
MTLKEQVVNTLTCDYCGIAQQFTEFDEVGAWTVFQIHLLQNDNEQEYEHMCPTCFKSFRTWRKENENIRGLLHPPRTNVDRPEIVK